MVAEPRQFGTQLAVLKKLGPLAGPSPQDLDHGVQRLLVLDSALPQTRPPP